MIAVDRAGEASSAEQLHECAAAARVNDRMSGRASGPVFGESVS